MFGYKRVWGALLRETAADIPLVFFSAKTAVVGDLLQNVFDFKLRCMTVWLGWCAPRALPWPRSEPFV